MQVQRARAPTRAKVIPRVGPGINVGAAMVAVAAYVLPVWLGESRLPTSSKPPRSRSCPSASHLSRRIRVDKGYPAVRGL